MTFHKTYKFSSVWVGAASIAGWNACSHPDVTIVPFWFAWVALCEARRNVAKPSSRLFHKVRIPHQNYPTESWGFSGT
jgi:hypothetical protein